MMLAWKNLRVVHVTTHVSLHQACDMITKQRALEVIRIANDACKAMGIDNPRVGVAGLNSHAGENGLFGREEMEQVLPAVKIAEQQGILAHGPIPADTLLSKALGGWYDVVVCMYHDQGHIPLKVFGFSFHQQNPAKNRLEGPVSK